VRLTKTFYVAAALLASLGASACGRSGLGRSPSQVVIDTLEGASGAKPDTFGSTLLSDVVTYVKQTQNGTQVQVPTIFNDLGRVKFHLLLRDVGTADNPATPTGINSVTFTRYRVEYVRTDGRNTQGVDVPYTFDSAFTATVPPNGDVTVAFDLVRHTAKQEAPLSALVARSTPPVGAPQVVTVQPVISTIAQVTFYGKDLAGNDVVATGSIGVSFGDFGDPE
jgi:hypothetical protein